VDEYYYIRSVLKYWDLEYPYTPMGDVLYVNKDIKSLIKNCHSLNWTPQRCCSRIYEMFFSSGNLTLKKEEEE
jgi:hypothetical protein